MSDAAKPAKPSTAGTSESCQDQSLLRDLGIINARVTREQGVAPRGGQRVQAKRKPDLPRHASSTLGDADRGKALDEG